MDLVDYQQAVYEEIESDFRSFAEEMNFDTITPIPMAALKGDNVVVSALKRQLGIKVQPY